MQIQKSISIGKAVKRNNNWMPNQFNITYQQMKIAENLNFHPQLDIINQTCMQMQIVYLQYQKHPESQWLSGMRKKYAANYLIMCFLSFLPHFTYL